MLKKLGLSLAVVGVLAMPAFALENSALGNVGQLQGIKQFVQAKMDALETLLNGLNSQVSALQTKITAIQACGANRQFTDTNDNCLSLWNYSSSGPVASFGGQVRIGSPGTSSYKLDVDGQIRATGYFHNSDESLKENFNKLEGLEIVTALNGLSYEWKDSHQQDVGLVAQDVEKVLPQLVMTDPDSGLKAVDYTKVVAPLVEAVKELNNRIAVLEAEKAAQ